MNLNKPSQELGAFSLALGAALLMAQLRCEAANVQQQEQQQSQPQQQQSQPPPSPTPPPSSQPASDPATSIGPLPVKRRKVWTNDEVVALRTSTDNYLAEKDGQEAADAEAAAKEAAIRAALKSDKQPPLDIKLPATAEETEKMLRNMQGDIQEETVVLEKMRQELADVPPEREVEKQKEIDRLTENVRTLRRDVKALEDHLQTFREKPQGENTPPAPQPRSI
jgi:hypothetical protein